LDWGMARSGRPKAALILTPEEHEQLVRWSRRAKSAQALALRSKIVLACAEGLDNKVAAERLGCEEHTVSKWRRRFVERRLEGLSDERRPGRPRTISVDQVEDVIEATLESTPVNATHWSRAKMAERSGLSKATIGKIWKDFGLKPHLVEHFKLSTDPLLKLSSGITEVRSIEIVLSSAAGGLPIGTHVKVGVVGLSPNE